jgi:hypothetical protein
VFQNGYWFPIEDFLTQYEDGVYHGISHLMRKRWFSELVLKEVLIFLKSEFPDIDFLPTVNKVKSDTEKLHEFFKTLKVNLKDI